MCLLSHFSQARRPKVFCFDSEMPPRTRSPHRAVKPSGPRSWTANSQTSREAGSDLLRLLLSLYSSCKLSAVDFTSICHYLALANMPGGCFDVYASPPNPSASGNAQKHLDRVMPMSAELMVVKAPAQYNHSSGRNVMDVPVKVLWSSITSEIEHTPSILGILDAEPNCDDQSILDVPAYVQHPAVVRARRERRRRPLPLSIY